jgi:agmatine deiminase
MIRTRFNHVARVLFLMLLFAVTAVESQPPPYDVRPLAEFERHEGVLIGWYDLGSYGPAADAMWAAAVDAIQEVAIAYIGVRYSSSVGEIQNYLISQGIPLDKVEFIVSSQMFGVWVRDYGPEFVYKPNGELAIVEGGYHHAYNTFLAGLWGMEHYEVPLSLQGGNYMADGTREVAVSSRYVSNPETWKQTVRSYYDLPLHLVPYLHQEPCGHIDMYARFVAPGKIVMSQYADPVYNDNLDEAAAQFEAHGYEVFRVQTPPVTAVRLPQRAIDDPTLLHLPPGVPPPEGEYRNTYKTYTNGIQCNGLYLLPVYNHPLDVLAEEVFQTALPDHQIIPINCSYIIQYGGALHCTSSDLYQPACPRSELVNVFPAGNDAVITWAEVLDAASYEILRRDAPLGYEEDLDDIMATTTGTSWTDVGALNSESLFVYHVITVSDSTTRSVLTPRYGVTCFGLNISP